MQNIQEQHVREPRTPSSKHTPQEIFGTVMQIRHSVYCRQARHAGEKALADRFWMRRYQQTGLLDPFSDGVEVTSEPRTCFPISSDWTPLVFVAYRVTEVTSGETGDRRTQSPRFPIRNQRSESVCGTVTLLVPTKRPADSSSATPEPKRIGRVSRLAIDHQGVAGQSAASYRSVFLNLTGTMHQTALELGLTHMDAIVHPRHAKLYSRIFNAVPIGDPFECDEVRGAPGQYMRADISKPSRFHQRLRGDYDTAVVVQEKRRG